MAGVLSEAWGTPPVGSRAHPSALIEMPHSDAAAPAAPPNPYARHPVGARDRSQPGTKWCLWEVLKDYRRGLPISDMLREIVNRGLRNFDGNKNPLGQIAGDLVRDRAHFFHFSGTNIWCLRCFVPQKLLEESGEPPPVARIAKEARPKPASDAGRGSGSRKQQAQARAHSRAGGSVSAASAPVRAAPRRAASAGVASAIAAAAHRPAPELDMPPGCGSPGGPGLGPATAPIARSISDTGQQQAAAAPGMALHTLLAMQQASQGLALQQGPLQQLGAAACRPQPSKQQLVRMHCRIWSENEGQYKTGEVVGYDPSSDLHQVSYGNRDMDLGIRFLSYEVVAAPETPTGLAVVVQRAQIMPQLSTRIDNPQAALLVAAQPAGIRRATSADRADGGGSARLIRPIARSFVTPQPSSPLDTASSPWTALMQASGGSFLSSPAGAFSQPGDFGRPGSGAWHGMQTPLSTLAALSPPGLPTGWFSQPLPISRAASATAAELQQAAGWQQGLHSTGSGLNPVAPATRGLPPVAPATAAPQHSNADTMSAAPLSAAAMSGGLTLQDVVRAGLISPAGPAQQSTGHAADVGNGPSYTPKAAASGSYHAAVASARYAGDDVFPLPGGQSALVTAGGSDASAATSAGPYIAHLGEEHTTMLPDEMQRHMLAPAPAATRRAGGLPEEEHLTALQGPATVATLATGYAANQQTHSSAAAQPCRPQTQGSTLDKHSNTMTSGSRSAGGIAAMIGGAKRPRLGGNGDQHFVQQPLSVAQ